MQNQLLKQVKQQPQQAHNHAQLQKTAQSKPTPEGRDKKLRDNLTEHQIDKMVKDSFPASDAPSTY